MPQEQACTDYNAFRLKQIKVFKPLKQKTLLLLILCLLMTTPGCIRRRLMVRSNPPGATVHIDNQPIGVTPCGVDFIYYGTREVRLSMQGYETLTVNQPIPTPWYEFPGVDFVTENLIPNRIEDIRTVSYNLTRQRMAPAEEIVSRGQELRGQVTPQGAAPIGSSFVAPGNAANVGSVNLGDPNMNPYNAPYNLTPPIQSQPTQPTLAPQQPALQPSLQPTLTPRAPTQTFAAPPNSAPPSTQPTTPGFRY